MGFLIFGRPNVEKLDAKGDIEGLVRAAGYRRDPAVGAAARAALAERREFFVAELGSRNLRRVVLSREALKRIGEPSVTILTDVLVHGDDGKRRDAAFALGEVGLPSGVAALERALRDRDEIVRLLAVKSLARIDDERVPRLLESALRDRDEAVRSQAAKALKRVAT